jgi:hypothetical protein
MKLVQNACRQRLPEFGTDHECCEGRVIDIDTYTEQGFRDIAYPPCPICNSSEFSRWLADLIDDRDFDSADRLLKASERARWRINMQKKGQRA